MLPLLLKGTVVTVSLFEAGSGDMVEIFKKLCLYCGLFTSLLISSFLQNLANTIPYNNDMKEYYEHLNTTLLV